MRWWIRASNTDKGAPHINSNKPFKNQKKFITQFQWIWSQKRGKIGITIFLFYCFTSLFSGLITNPDPLFLKTQSGNWKFPLFWKYSSEKMGLNPDFFYIEYRDECQKNYFHNCIFTLNPWGPLEQTDDVLAPPSRQHFLGTDNLGRDIFARLIYGVHIALKFGFLLWIISYSFGVLVGIAQGYFLGKIDFFIERLKELATLIPILTIIILVTSITRNQSFYLILSLVLLFQWIGMASQMRATSLSVSRLEFPAACRALGGGHFRIITKHILPNSLAPIITLSPFALEAGISLLASLDYLGFGLPPPTPSLGELLSQGKDHIQTAPWVILAPICVIVTLLVSINFIAQCLRDVWDPKKSKGTPQGHVVP